MHLHALSTSKTLLPSMANTVNLSNHMPITKISKQINPRIDIILMLHYE
uniref:Uncharacterized protein n=1 Tax=Arundo donax TaxID=35708 RepID=A0A0A9GXM1_ARUDO